MCCVSDIVLGLTREVSSINSIIAFIKLRVMEETE